jgi:hypothetical protein
MDRPETKKKPKWADFIKINFRFMWVIDRMVETANGKHLMARFRPSILYTFWYTGIEINAN